MNTETPRAASEATPQRRSGSIPFFGQKVAPAGGEGGLPLSHRLSIVYLAVPVVVWLVGWFEWWMGFPMAGLLVAGLWKSLSGSWRVSLSLPLLASLLAALGWVLVTPTGGLWSFSQDLHMQYATLLDMGRGGWPTYLTDHRHGDPPLLAYYLGWHMVPSLAGRWLGLAALGWAVPVWTWIGVGLIAAVLTRGLTTVRAALLAVAVLVFFSGADILEHVLRLGPYDTVELLSDRLRRGSHLEWDGHIVGPNAKNLEYQPSTIIFWLAPHHFISGALGALVILRSRRRPELAAVCGLVVVICAFWSPISAVGLLPLVAVMAISQGVRPFLRWPNLLAAPPLAGLIGLYLNSNDAETNWGWLPRHYDSAAEMLADLIPLYAAEVALVALALWLTDRRLAKEPAFIASVAVLAVAPWITYRINQTHDVMLRLATPALIVLTYYAARALLSQLPEPVSGAFPPPPRRPRRRWYAALVAVLCVGAATPIFTLLNSNNRDYSPYGQTHKILLANNQLNRDYSPRIATSVPRWLQTILRDHDQKGLPTREPIISSKYDVYLQEQAGLLVYLNRDCDLGAERPIRFFLHVQTRQDRWKIWSYRRDSSDCASTLSLPDYDIDRIVIGQYTANMGILWAAEYRLSDPKPVHYLHSDAYQPYSFYYQIAADEDPLISSVFNVHLARLHEPTLIYTKEPCTQQDIRTPFFLHIIPENPDDLSESRRRSGFDNHDFHFNDLDKTHSNRCLALIPLPDYPIASIRTGQFNPDTDHTLWQQETDTSQ